MCDQTILPLAGDSPPVIVPDTASETPPANDRPWRRTRRSFPEIGPFMMRHRKWPRVKECAQHPARLVRMTLIATVAASVSCAPRVPLEGRDADVIVVGAGIAGLSSAVEMARGGADVLVVDMSSVFGGHAVSAHGGLAIVGSPEQQAAGIADSPDLAFADFMNWGEDAEEEWVRYYVNNSKTAIHDWVTDLGVVFEDLWHLPGNSVPRFHNVRGRGLGLVTPIYLGALRAGVRFRWNTRVDELIVQNGRVVGVRGTGLRGDSAIVLRSPIVLLATGGFQSNLERVRDNWNDALPFPDRILAGSGWNSQGLGLDLARAAGAAFHRLDHQWNYVTGVPDPRYPDADRGLNVLIDHAIWVNVEGRRFVDECAAAKTAFPAVVKQPTGSYWAIFDARGREGLLVSGSGWTEERVQREIIDNPDLVKQASTIADLAALTGVPTEALTETVTRFNTLVDEGVDSEFQRFGQGDGNPLACQQLERLERPPYFAVRNYPLARKSMGGIAIDLAGHVLNEQGGVIPGLYAGGEVSGFAGINGKAGLEGTFLGPSILTGRVAGQSIVSELRGLGALEARSVGSEVNAAAPEREDFPNTACTECHLLPSLVEAGRPGYWHFELSHREVLRDQRQCNQCHGGLLPYDENAHQVDPRRRAQACRFCHGLQAID